MITKQCLVICIVALLSLLVGSVTSAGPTTTPVWVDSTGKQLGPLGFSDSIAQGVVLNVTGTGPQNQTQHLWVLVPFTVNGTGYETYFSPSNGPSMIYNQFFFTNTNCQGTAYLLAPDPKQLSKNSQTNPYSAFMGSGFSIYFPFGTPQLGTNLGIASTYLTLGLPTLAFSGPCVPALSAPGEYFAPIASVDLEPTVFSNQGFTPPWSLVLP